ncbi:Ribosome maturation factor RimM [Caloramator mitchellensis]|uniref:Ribosome maturation factor RimM n=1 Tax=Caloramator mitchellensis TaxID=908809 RepID=A0A0R3JTU8_CALMK|nr:ribosome maturation factor RimM [Caloramator mitchellensis]KRQ86960.1 Ribosome maturation factor RimM [Caloramator mitchellensis]
MVEYLKIGQIINTHGVKGELKVYPLTDDINRFKDLRFVFLKSNDNFIKKEVNGVKFFKNIVILKIDGIENMNAAEKLKEQYLYIDRENAVKLPEDTYFIADLIGINVVDVESGKLYGNIKSVFSTGSNDVYELETDEGKIILIPAIKDVVKEVDINGRTMKINMIEGLI